MVRLTSKLPALSRVNDPVAPLASLHRQLVTLPTKMGVDLIVGITGHVQDHLLTRTLIFCPLGVVFPPAMVMLMVSVSSGAVIVAGAVIFPFQPTFAAILAIGVVPLITYQYWRDVRVLHMPMVAATVPAQWPGIRLTTAIMSSLALTTVDPVHGSSGEDGLDPQTSFRNG